MIQSKKTVIVGAGLTGLVAAHKIKRTDPGHSLIILERDSRAGGAIRSSSENGFMAEYGPHGFLDNCIESRNLLLETGLDREAVKAPLKTFVRYVCLNGSLMLIPQSPMKIIRAPLIPWKDKIRVLGDLFKKPLEGDPTAAKWAAYRFGRALLPYVDAVFTGTYAGDYNELRMNAVMPGVRELEKQYGSVIRGAVARARAARKKRKAGTKLEMPAMTSFPGGMQRLSDRLAEGLEERELILNCSVESLHKTADGWQVETADGTFQADNVLLALPVNQCLKLLKPLGPIMSVDRIPEARIVTVVFGFKGAALPPGFGYLIPEQEKRFTLGTLFSSNMFPNRAPEGHIVFETLVGGIRHQDRVELDDASLAERSLSDVRELLNIPGTPDYIKVLRPKNGIPQLGSGYTDVLNWRNNLVCTQPGLYVCGFGWEGIGINDMIKTTTSAVSRLVAGDPQFQDKAEVKKIYF